MMKKQRQIYILISLMYCCFSFIPVYAADEQETQLPSFISAAVRKDYYPISFMERDKPAGFDVDVLMHATERANLGISIEMMDILDMLTAIPSGALDAASGMIITPERRGYLDFTVPYFTDRYVLVSARSGGILGLGELSGKRLAYYPEDFAVDTFVAFFNYKMDMKIAPSVKDAVLLVNRGEADYTIIPYSYGASILRSLGLEKQLIIGREIIPAEYRFAVSKNNSALLFILNDAILQMQADGTLSNLVRRWNMTERERLDPYWYFVIACAAALVVFFFSGFVLYRKKTEEMQAAAAQRCWLFSSLLDALPFPIVWKDSSFKELGSNEQYRRMQSADTGCSSDIREQKFVFSLLPGDTHTVFVYQDTYSETLLRNENARLSAQIASLEITRREMKITDSETGFFNVPYIAEKLDEEILAFDKTGKRFTAVSLMLRNDMLNKEDLRTAVSIIKESVGSACICAYAGFGTFILLFPQKKKDTVEVFVGGTVEVIERDTSQKGISFFTEEYDGQGRSQLLGRLHLEGLF